MKYIKPMNETNEDAGYVNADVSIGRRGSTVPAAAVEAPQRELVHLITSAGLTPDDTDRTQVKQAIDAVVAAAIVGKADASSMTSALAAKADKTEAVLSTTIRTLVVLESQAAYDALTDEQKADPSILYAIKG